MAQELVHLARSASTSISPSLSMASLSVSLPTMDADKRRRGLPEEEESRGVLHCRTVEEVESMVRHCVSLNVYKSGIEALCGHLKSCRRCVDDLSTSLNHQVFVYTCKGDVCCGLNIYRYISTYTGMEQCEGKYRFENMWWCVICLWSWVVGVAHLHVHRMRVCISKGKMYIGTWCSVLDNN